MPEATTTVAANVALDAAHSWQRAADLLRHQTGLRTFIRVDGSLQFFTICSDRPMQAPCYIVTYHDPKTKVDLEV